MGSFWWGPGSWYLVLWEEFLGQGNMQGWEHGAGRWISAHVPSLRR